MNGLEEIELIPQGRMGRFFGKKLEENAYREVNNLVATSPIFQIYHDGVLAVLRGYGITLDQARPRLIEMFTKVLEHFAKDGDLSDLDHQHIDRLADLFGFPQPLREELINTTLPAILAKRSTKGES
jgi:hypothetical protein